MRHILGAMALMLAALAGTTPALGQSQVQFTPLQVQDLRLAQIADRIMSANQQLCIEKMPITGMVFHSVDQYPQQDAGTEFANGRIEVAAIVPGSPADIAELQIGDGIVAINSQPTADLTSEGDAPLRDSAFDLLAAQSAEMPLELTIQRGDELLELSLEPVAGCRALVEIITGSGLVGRSDGRVIQVSYELAQLLDDQELAVIFAHELAHAVLLHRKRLVEAGVSKDLLGEFGRNQQLNREVEVEADRLSIHLLANAGYDPQLSVQFWRSTTGQQAGGGLLRSFIYPAPTSRSDLMAREIAQYLPLGRGPSWPGHLLARRNLPF